MLVDRTDNGAKAKRGRRRWEPRMSFDVALARMAQLQSLFTPAAAAPAPIPPTAPSTTTSFASQLQSAGATATLNAPTPTAPTAPTAPPASAGSAGEAILNAIRPEVGVAEQPPGSNDSPRIAQYRQATAGSGV